jgi:hypothetical protein
VLVANIPVKKAEKFIFLIFKEIARLYIYAAFDENVCGKNYCDDCSGSVLGYDIWSRAMLNINTTDTV